MFKKSLTLTSLTLLLAVPATQISGGLTSASSSKRLRTAPKILRGYWQDDYGHGSFIEHIAKHKVTYISKGYEPDIFITFLTTDFIQKIQVHRTI
ncbi:hypothetical protein LAC03_01600 [Levilactobacillus acidifarinae]|nr:hypothetical protein LAC03_01600 [Levilactobacillus acidifarinae]